MDLKKIPIEAQNLIFASSYINNFTRAIEELIYNSLDAESTSIAIRVSIQDFFIQILDNGFGIKEENFRILGQKYTTSKYIDVCTLKSAPDKYGYRGLSLASIIEISQNVLISSRPLGSDATWIKRFHNGTEDVCIASARPSKGTTVEIKGFLYNLNIQRKSIDPIHELQYIRSSLEKISLIHCNVSISLRDDYKNEIIFKMHRNRDIYQTMQSLFEINKDDVQELQVEKNQYKVKAFIGKDNVLKSNQWIYLNGKFITRTDIHKKINKAFNMSLLKNNKIMKIKNKIDENVKSDAPFYFIFISCPFYDFDVIYKRKQTLIEFKDWTEIDKLIEKLVQFYCGEVKLKQTYKETECDNKKDIDKTKMKVKRILQKYFNNQLKQSSLSSVHGVKGKNIKRKSKKKSQKLLNHSPPKRKETKTNVRDPTLLGKNGTEDIIIKPREPKKLLENKQRKKHKKKEMISNKIRKKSKHIDPLVSRFINENDSVKVRRERIYTEARKLLRTRIPENKMISLTYAAEYNETYSYCAMKADYEDNIFRNNIDFAKPKTSYDLIKPFNQSYVGILNDPVTPKIPETQTKQWTRSSHHIHTYKSDYSKSLHIQNTFNSHHYENYTETKSAMKHFINTNSFRDFLSREQNDEKLENNTEERMFYTIEGKEKGTIDTYQHKDYDGDNISDKYKFDLPIKQSLDESNYMITNEKHNIPNKGNNLNETYTVLISDNFKDKKDVNLSINKESFLNVPIVNEQNKTKSLIEQTNESNEALDNKEPSESLDPLNYCETIFRSNEMSDIAKEFMLSFNNCRDVKSSTDFELPVDTRNDMIDGNLMNNENINNKEQSMNWNPPNSESHILTQKPDQDLNNFQLKRRHELVPKGMSQIYRTRSNKNTDITISENIDYYENILYEKFADQVLLNSEIFAPSIQNVEVKSRNFEKEYRNDNLVFNVSSLKGAKIFGQVDRKFIATQINGASSSYGGDDVGVDFLVLFDQHAVDERIKLEANLADYFDGNTWYSVPSDPVPLELDENNLLYLHNHRQKFHQFGLQWIFQHDKIIINSIPKAFIGKSNRQEQIILKSIKRLILEVIDVINILGGNVTLYPKAIMDLVFSEACRNAIKFGDKLSHDDCLAMVTLLSSCKTPFQCAHGRPVMAVLMEIPKNIRYYRVDVRKIKLFKSRKYI